MPVRLVIQGGPYPDVSSADVRRRARAMLEAVQLPRAELSVLLTGDREIQELNRTYRKKNRPTDVLAFAQREGELGERAGRLLGDVVVSIPTARRQADARRRRVTSELTMLLAHGLLHLLGWDHETVAKDRLMRRETTRLCAAADAACPAAQKQRAPSRTRKNVAHAIGHSVARRARPQSGSPLIKVVLRTEKGARRAFGGQTRREFAKQAVFPLRGAKSRC